MLLDFQATNYRDSIMKLTYRGVEYTSTKAQIQARSSNLGIIRKYRLSRSRDSNIIIPILPRRYYTYRGVSYIKTSVFDLKTQILLDTDRQ